MALPAPATMGQSAPPQLPGCELRTRATGPASPSGLANTVASQSSASACPASGGRFERSKQGELHGLAQGRRSEEQLEPVAIGQPEVGDDEVKGLPDQQCTRRPPVASHGHFGVPAERTRGRVRRVRRPRRRARGGHGKSARRPSGLPRNVRPRPAHRSTFGMPRPRQPEGPLLRGPGPSPGAPWHSGSRFRSRPIWPLKGPRSRSEQGRLVERLRRRSTLRRPTWQAAGPSQARRARSGGRGCKGAARAIFLAPPRRRRDGGAPSHV